MRYVTTPDGHRLSVERDQEDPTAVQLMLDGVEPVASLRPVGGRPRHGGLLEWELEFSVFYYHPSHRFLGPPTDPPINDALAWVDFAIEDAE